MEKEQHGTVRFGFRTGKTLRKNNINTKISPNEAWTKSLNMGISDIQQGVDRLNEDEDS